MKHRILEISGQPRHIGLYRGLAVISDKHHVIGRVDFDTVMAVLISSHGATVSTPFIAECATRKIPILFCDSRFQVTSMASPLHSHHDQTRRIYLQAKARQGLLNKLWQQIVKAKILNQSLVLRAHFHPYANRLKRLAKEVKISDAGNREAVASRIYWQALFGKSFRRDQKADGINGMLNYGYAVIRSAVLSHVLASGLNPSLGIHHHNYHNPFCLVDDLMEPFRPHIDQLVKALVLRGETTLSSGSKSTLAKLLICDLGNDADPAPYGQTMLSFVQSYLACLASGTSSLTAVPSLSVFEANKMITGC